MDRSLLKPVGILVISLAVLAVALHFAAYPKDEMGAAPNADWSWNETGETITVTHRGGDTIESAALYVIVDSGEGARPEQAVRDLTNESDDQIRRPFPEESVSDGDALVLEKSNLRDGDIYLSWQAADGDRTASLAMYDFEGESE